MRLFSLALLAGALPAFSTTLTVLAQDFTDTCTNIGATAAYCYVENTNLTASLARGGESVTSMSDLQYELQGNYNSVLEGPPVTSIGQPVLVLLQASFTVPANWASAVVRATYLDATSGFDLTTPYATISGPGVTDTISAGEQNEINSFDFTPGTSSNLFFEAGGGSSQYGTYRDGYFDFLITGTIAPSPEPSSFAMLVLPALGAAALLFRKVSIAKSPNDSTPPNPRS